MGSIMVSKSWIVTPVGNVPTKGASVSVMDFTRTETRIPTWAIVLAILGAFFFLLGLLFLLARESYTAGNVQITVRNGNFVFATQLPVTDQGSLVDAHSRVAYANQVIAAAS
jgi:hypothetical protein